MALAMGALDQMRHSFPAIAVLGGLALTLTSAHGAVLFSSEPHILALGQRQQVILFAQDGIDGAISTRRADGTWDVVIPNATVDQALADRSFVGPPVGEQGRATQVDLESVGTDVRLRVRPAGDVARVVAYGVRNPPRLMVDLLSREAARKESAAREKSAARRETERATQAEERGTETVSDPGTPTVDRNDDAVSESVAPELSRAENAAMPEKAPAQMAGEPAPKDPGAEDRTVAPTQEPEPGAVDAAAAEGGPMFPPTTGLASAEHPQDETSLLESTEPAPAGHERVRLSAGDAVDGEGREGTEDVASSGAGAAAGVASESLQDRIPVAAVEFDGSDGSGRVALALGELADRREEHCLYTRVSGVPFCAPNGDALGYVEDAYSSGLARRIAAGATWVAKVQGTVAPAKPYLEADREFLTHARKGWLLGTISAYTRALRLSPGFPDAVRAHMNIALIYAQLGFRPELEMQASNSTNPARGFASAVLGDQRLEEGRFRDAADLYEFAADEGGMAACVAARGLAGLALAEGRTERAYDGLSMLRDLCPRGFVDDPDTERLRARIALSLGDANRALATLDQVEARLRKPERGEILLERATIAEEAGRLDEAHEAWSELETGRYGPKLEAHAAIALARLEGTRAAVDDGLSRLEDLPPEDRERARNELLVGASDDALSNGDGLSAVAMVLSEGLDSSKLAPRAQVELAGSYRRLGLYEEARKTLDRVERRGDGGFPESYWRERGALALATGDLGAAEEILRRWQRSRGGNPSTGEIELRVAVLAGRNASRAAIQTALERLNGLDPQRATSARWRAAADLADRDPATATALLESAGQLEKLPDLPEDQLANTLWALGRGGEEHGESAVALAAYQALGLGLPESARGAEASYRAARILEVEQEFSEAERAFRRAAVHPKAIDRRQAEASSAYHSVVRPWPRRQENL